jgi:hypothetical protein
LRRVLLVSEDDVKKKLQPQKPNVEIGIWVEILTTDATLAGSNPNPMPYPVPRGGPGGRQPPPPPQATAPGAPASTIQITCRSLDMSSVDPSANNTIAFDVETQLKNSPLFDPKGTTLSPTITADPTTGTFTFGITVALLNPLKL